MTVHIQRLSAFPSNGSGGNPAGVVLDAHELNDAQMQEIAAQVGYSETVFITSGDGPNFRVRYFSPEMEVDFCGHATIAAGVALGGARGAGTYNFETNTGEVSVRVAESETGFVTELSSHTASISPLVHKTLIGLLEILNWPASVLSEDHSPLIANAGNSHPILVLNNVETLKNLDYDFESLKTMCRENNWPTVQIVAKETSTVWRSRNPFAFGGVYEDPATGSAALAFGVYLRETQKAKTGDVFTIKQGFEMGQPCELKLAIEKNSCSVSGSAIEIHH